MRPFARAMRGAVRREFEAVKPPRKARGASRLSSSAIPERASPSIPTRFGRSVGLLGWD